MQNLPKGVVVTDPLLRNLGISKDLKHNYIRHHWLKSIGYGAVIKIGEEIDWRGGISALQNQLKLLVHIGGKTALDIKGVSHFVRFDMTKILLFADKNTNIPKWFQDYEWKVKMEFIRGKIFSNQIGIEQVEVDGIKLNISSVERAIMELLYFIPDQQSFEEAKLIMENLISLRPKLIQTLLENCCSIKVKRIFLYLAENLNHPWFRRLNVSKINLGKGKRCIVKNGSFKGKYQITVPRNFFNEE